MKVKHYIILFFLFMLIACEKEITIDLPRPEPKAVIEGSIEQGQYPWVFVTRSAAYFDKFDSTVFAGMLDTGATVIVGNGIEYDTLQLTLDFFTFPYLKYAGSKFLGEVGKNYSLKVITGGKTYEATTTIPQPIAMDSIKFKPELNEDTIGLIWIYLKDPAVEYNYYRAFTKVIGKDQVFLHPFPSVTDDRFFDGINAEYSLYKGRNPLEDDMYDDNGIGTDGVPRWLFRESDKVIVKLCAIDAKHFEFWYSTEQQAMMDGNPFSSPVSARTNISNGALGVWGGYGVFIDTIDIAASLNK